MRRRLALTAFVAAVAVAEIWFAVQIRGHAETVAKLTNIGRSPR